MARATMHGVYVGNDATNLTQFQNAIGAHPENVMMYTNGDSWQGFEDSIGWATNLWKDTPTPRIWGVPLTVTGTSLDEVASGAHNASYLKAAQAFLATSPPSADGNIYVRVGWEANGDWFPWSAKGHEQAYVDAFHQVVDTFRSVSPNFKFVWDVTPFNSSYDPAKFYPGDHYVDVVGTDIYYNKTWDAADPHAAFQQKIDDPNGGLKWQQDFAAAHGKATAISEWGVQSDDAGPFVKDMAAWLQSHHMVYDNYWESNSDFPGVLTQYPNAALAYKQAFVDTAPVVDPPAPPNPIDSPTPPAPVDHPLQHDPVPEPLVRGKGVCSEGGDGRSTSVEYPVEGRGGEDVSRRHLPSDARDIDTTTEPTPGAADVGRHGHGWHGHGGHAHGGQRAEQGAGSSVQAIEQALDTHGWAGLLRRLETSAARGSDAASSGQDQLSGGHASDTGLDNSRASKWAMADATGDDSGFSHHHQQHDHLHHDYHSF